MSESKTVLLVEDEAIVSMTLQKMLGQIGFDQVVAVSSGEQAIEVAQNEKIAVALMDIMLSGKINGIEAALRLFELDIPVIFVTALPDQNSLEKSLAANPYGYMIKPVRERDLLLHIRVALHQHRLVQELKEKISRLEP